MPKYFKWRKTAPTGRGPFALIGFPNERLFLSRQPPRNPLFLAGTARNGGAEMTEREKLAEAMERVKDAAPLRQWCDQNLNPAGRSYECPICHSGTGPNKTPAFTIGTGRYANTWKCHSCQSHGDVFDLAGIVYGTEDRAEQLERVAAWAGVEGWQRGGGAADRGEALDWNSTATIGTPRAAQVAAPTKQAPDLEGDYAKGRAKHRAYIEAAQANIGAPEAVAYLASRGIDLETARAWGLGYDPNAGGAKDADGNWCRRGRIVIPWAGSGYYHIDRAIAPDVAQAKYHKPKSAEVGPQPLWNPAALQAPAFFVVEGALDALAVQSCGYPAIALGSTGDTDLVEAMTATTKGVANGAGTAVLMLDNDGAGHKAQADLAEALGAAGLAYVSAPTEDMGAKDAGEAVATDKARLTAWLADLYTTASERLRADQEAAYAAVLAKLRVLNPVYVAGSIYTLEVAREPIPTGIAGLDRALGGGLPSRGLVATGAISSFGKTTLWVQIADNLAAAGRTVLFVTVEQSAEEIVAKSISRLISTTPRPNGGRMWASSQAVMSRAERDRWAAEDPDKLAALAAACERYSRIVYSEGGARQVLHIMEAATQPTVADIRTAAEQIAGHNGEAPVVIIDYLQLLAPEAGYERDSDKQIVDHNIMALRQMARDMDTCVSVISSLNRASYNGTVSLESFKESGAIEYGTDVLLGLQPRGIESELEDRGEQAAKREAKKLMKDFKANERRECEVVVLKNRNGRVWRDGVPLVYEAVSNLFLEGDAERRIADGEA